MKRAIFGCGEIGKTFYDAIVEDIKIDFFIDNFKTGDLNGIPIKRLDDIKELELLIYNSVRHTEDEILDQIKTFKNIQTMTFTETIQQFPKILEKLYEKGYMWLDGDLYTKDTQEISKYLYDDKSRYIFENWLNLRKTLDPKYLIKPTNSLDEQYFPKDLSIKSEKFVDCGGYIGDTIELYYNYNNGSVISFEPDKKNLKSLIKVAKNKDVLVYPAGVYSSTEILRFNSSGSSSGIDANGDVFVPVTSLDETIYNYKPDYIKMDIEGAEMEALRGAKNIIKDFTPNLAISIYHKPEDLWKIQNFISSINNSYKFYLRTHHTFFMETILYCTK